MTVSQKFCNDLLLFLLLLSLFNLKGGGFLTDFNIIIHIHMNVHTKVNKFKILHMLVNKYLV